MNYSFYRKISFKVVLEYGLYLLAFLLSLQTRLFLRSGEIAGGYSEYLTISLYGVDILIIILLIFNFFRKLKVLSFSLDSVRDKKLRVWYIIGGLELIIFISCLFASDKILAFYRYGIFLLSIGLIWLIVSVNFNKIKLLLSFLVGLFFQASLAIWQFFSQSSFSFKWLGLAKHNPSDLGVSVIETIGYDGIGERWLRAYGGFDHPNVLGGALVIGLILFISQSSKNDKIFKKNTYFQILYYLLFGFLIVALFFSFSRAAWLALFVGILVILILTFIEKDWAKQKNILELILVGSIIIFFLFSQFGNLVNTRMGGDTRLENKSNSERVTYLHQARDIINDRVLIGAGIGNYVNELDREEKKEAWDYQAVHNVFLLVLAEIGIFGLIGFICFLVYLGVLSVRSSRSSYVGLPLIFSLVIIMILDHWLWSSHFGVLLFWFVSGLIIRESK